MHAPASRKDLLWTVSVGIEAQAQALMGSASNVTEMLAELRTGFARAPYPVCADVVTSAEPMAHIYMRTLPSISRL